MPTCAKIRPMPRALHHRVVAVAYDGLCTFEFGVVAEIFALKRPELTTDSWYTFQVCSLESGPVRALGGITVQPRAGLSALRRADTVVIPGWKNSGRELPPAELVKAIQRAHSRGARIVSICSGAFVLAAAGLLDGKRATTHWHHADRLAAQYPLIRVDPDVLYVDEGTVMTSAGSAAGIDLCLHIVRKDFGAAISNRVARRLVVSPHRDGDQSQYVAAAPLRHMGSEDRFSKLLNWSVSHIDQELTVGALARQANMSARNFARRFREETGTTPHLWLTRQRLGAAQQLLETTDHPVDRVAELVGMHSAVTLRHHFRQAFRTTPTAYRLRFARKQAVSQ
jgi:AraC family transcriptional activator FtrA